MALPCYVHSLVAIPSHHILSWRQRTGADLNPCLCLRHPWLFNLLSTTTCPTCFLAVHFAVEKRRRDRTTMLVFKRRNGSSSQHDVGCTGLTGQVTNANSQDLSTPLTNDMDIRLPTTGLHLGITRRSQPRSLAARRSEVTRLVAGA